MSAQAGQAGAVVFAPAPVLSLPEDYFPQLRELLAAALRESPRMLLARLDLDAAAGERTQARSGLYPSVSSTVRGVFTSDIRRDLPGSTEATKTYYDVGLSQPVFHWGEKRNTARIGDIRSAIAERDYAEGYRLLAREIRQGYLDLIVLKSRLAGARFMRGQAEEALKAAEARAKVGAIAEGELFGPQIALEQATLGEGSAELAFITARDQLEALTGKPAPAEAELPDELPKIETSNAAASDGLLAEFLAEPEPSTPALETLREQVEVAQLTYKNQKTRLRPKLSFVLGVSQDEQSYTLNNAQRYGVTSRYVGLQVSWSIFDGWATRGAVRSSLARLRQAQARYAQARSTAPRAAQASARALGLAQRQMQINDRLLVASADGLRIHEADFAAGRTASDAVAQARAGYYQARASANAARLNFLMGQVDLVSQIDRDPLIENLPRP
ncbi:hypothetical protein AXK11_07720 [Cephaloticoccus primus]|uniref:Transporter n=1 Tax=Cephaloticoccus primus TaxID=1548207 RepID=A0A139SJI6_9BACT|nr:hypothetical protein AXK11_07720 [Cephaloticoccus primus]